MGRSDGEAASKTYLVEHYRPGFATESLSCLIARLRDAVEQLDREGRRVRYVRSTIVPLDESFLCLFEASSEAQVREAYARAGVAFERISRAITPDG